MNLSLNPTMFSFILNPTRLLQILFSFWSQQVSNKFKSNKTPIKLNPIRFPFILAQQDSWGFCFLAQQSSSEFKSSNTLKILNLVRFYFILNLVWILQFFFLFKPSRTLTNLNPTRFFIIFSPTKLLYFFLAQQGATNLSPARLQSFLYKLAKQSLRKSNFVP